MATLATKQNLNPTKAPLLPLPPTEYSQQYLEQLTNAMRLYFNQLDNLSSTVLGPQGSRFLNAPYGAFFDTTSQHDGSTTIPYAMRLNETSYSNGVTIESRNVVSTASIATTTLTCTGITSGRFYPGMILSGTGVTAGTYIYLQLSSTANAVATPTFVSGGTSGQAKFVLSSVANIEARQFVSGTGVPANTRVVYVNTGTNEVTLSANFTVQASGTYTFRPWGYQGTYSVSPSQTVSSTTISGVTDSKITVANAGVYNVQFSAQFANTDASEYDADVWLSVNEVDVADSNTQLTVPKKHGSVNGHAIAAWNWFIELQANDYVEIRWRAENSALFIEYIGTQTTPIRPAVPSVIATVSFVSSLPA